MRIALSLKTGEARPTAAFTLIEMIGVLSVIAILAGMLVPKVVSAISDAKVGNTISSYQAIQDAVADHYAKFNAYNLTTNGVPLSVAQMSQFDFGALLPEGLIDKPFVPKVGQGAIIEIVNNGGFQGLGYRLDGTNVATARMQFVAEAVISNVTPQDAWDISTRLDGPLLTPTSVASVDVQGRACYTNNTLYLYISGR